MSNEDDEVKGLVELRDILLLKKGQSVEIEDSAKCIFKLYSDMQTMQEFFEVQARVDRDRYGEDSDDK